MGKRSATAQHRRGLCRGEQSATHATDDQQWRREDGQGLRVALNKTAGRMAGRKMG